MPSGSIPKDGPSAGITKIILSKENKVDLDEIPEEVGNELDFVLVESIEEVVKETLNIELPKPSFYHLENKAANTVHPL